MKKVLTFFLIFSFITQCTNCESRKDKKENKSPLTLNDGINKFEDIELLIDRAVFYDEKAELILELQLKNNTETKFFIPVDFSSYLMDIEIFPKEDERLWLEDEKKYGYLKIYSWNKEGKPVKFKTCLAGSPNFIDPEVVNELFTRHKEMLRAHSNFDSVICHNLLNQKTILNPNEIRRKTIKFNFQQSQLHGTNYCEIKQEMLHNIKLKFSSDSEKYLEAMPIYFLDSLKKENIQIFNDSIISNKIKIEKI